MDNRMDKQQLACCGYPHLAGVLRAPGRIRTCDARFRNPIRRVRSDLVELCRACSAPLLVSLDHVQDHRVAWLGWAIGWATRRSAAHAVVSRSLWDSTVPGSTSSSM